MQGATRRSIVAALASGTLFLSGCSVLNEGARQFESQFVAGTGEDPYRDARTDNLNRHVSQEFNPTPEVIPDRSRSGVEASQKFFNTSDTVVVSSSDMADQVRAASIAVVSHAPMLTMTDENRAEVVAEISRLKATYVLEVGDIPLASGDGAQRRIKDPGGMTALGELTALQFYPKAITYPTAVIQAVAALDPNDVSYLVPGWDEDTYREAVDQPSRRDTSRRQLPPFPAQSKRDAGMAPLVIASEQSSVAAVATAKAYGATVRSMRYPDPRFSHDAMKMVAGLADQPLIALGSHFGTPEQLSEKIRLGEKTTTQIAGSGGLVFPGRTVVAVNADTYNAAPIDNADGMDGDPQDPVRGLVNYAKTSQADVARHLDGNFTPSAIIDFGTVMEYYSNSDMEGGEPTEAWEEKARQLAAIADSQGYGIISITPVSGKLTRQLAALSPLLENPNVGIMLDLSKAAVLGTGIADAVTEDDNTEDTQTNEADEDAAPEYAPADPRISTRGFAGSGSDEGTTPRNLRGRDVDTTGVNPEATSGDDDIKEEAQRVELSAESAAQQGPVILTAQDINLASGWIARFVENNELPQKAFIVAQNAPGMIAQKKHLDTTSPHFAFTVLVQPAVWEDPSYFEWEFAKQRYVQVTGDYQDLGKEIFFGWGVSNIVNSPGASVGSEAAANFADFTKLSPRPWLIINN